MGFPIGAPLEPSPYLQAFSRYLALKCLSNANRHCACAISRDLCPLCKIWVHIWISHPTLPIHYDTFIGLRCVDSWDLQCQTRNRAKILSRPKFGKFWRFWVSWGQGFQNVSIFTPKGTCVRQSTSFEPFCVKIGRGVWPPGRLGKNIKSHRDSHREDMSPLTRLELPFSLWYFIGKFLKHMTPATLPSCETGIWYDMYEIS